MQGIVEEGEGEVGSDAERVIIINNRSTESNVVSLA